MTAPLSGMPPVKFAAVNGITLAKGQDATLTLSANATRSANYSGVLEVLP